jgi:hypothetical protein
MAIVWAEDKEIHEDDDDSDSDDDDETELSTSMFVSVSSSVNISDTPIPPMIPDTVGKVSLVPLDLGPRSVFDFTPEFCPTSGRVVVHWMSDTQEQAMTLHDIL